MKYDFCPICTAVMNDQNCTVCKFVHYDNPIPVVAVLIPACDDAEESATWVENHSAPSRQPGIVLVQRKYPLFVGGWCLPCGFVDQHEHPKYAACREVKEEAGIECMIEQILCVCNPMRGEVNQMTIHYLGRHTGYEYKAGDDAAAVQVGMQGILPKICFRSHQRIIDLWFDGEFGYTTGKDLTN